MGTNGGFKRVLGSTLEGDMDPALRALCEEVLVGDVDSERFAWLLIETGVNLDSFEWDIANKLLKEGDAINSLQKRFGNTVQ